MCGYPDWVICEEVVNFSLLSGLPMYFIFFVCNDTLGSVFGLWGPPFYFCYVGMCNVGVW